jgi:hypothetical protein
LPTFWAHSDLSRIIGLGASRLGIQAVHDDLVEAVDQANAEVRTCTPEAVIRVYWQSIRPILIKVDTSMNAFPTEENTLSQAQLDSARFLIQDILTTAHPFRSVLEQKLYLRVSFFEGTGGGPLRGETKDGRIGILNGVAGKDVQKGSVQRTVQGEMAARAVFEASVVQIVADELQSRVSQSKARRNGYQKFIGDVYTELKRAEAEYGVLIMDEKFWKQFSTWAEGFASAGWGSRKAARSESAFRSTLEIWGSEHNFDTLARRIPYHETRAITAANMDYLAGFSPRLIGNVLLLRFLDQKLSGLEADTRTHRMLAAVRTDIVNRVRELLSLTHLSAFPMELSDGPFGDMIGRTIHEVLDYFEEHPADQLTWTRAEKRRLKWLTLVGLHKVALERAIAKAQEARDTTRVSALTELRKWVVAASAGVVGRTG